MSSTAYRGVPQTATFEDSKRHADSLPAMPSWDTATSRRVEDYSQPQTKGMDDMEMGAMGSYNTGRRGYDHVAAEPMSPTGPVPGNFGSTPTHAQHADLGAQRMNNGYSNYASVPLSPAPTYQSQAPAASDRFMTGAASPAPHQYQQNTSSYAPSSTNYENDYSAPNHSQAPSYSAYNNTSSTAYDTGYARPPSLLQVGRKAVPGSMREV